MLYFFFLIDGTLWVGEGGVEENDVAVRGLFGLLANISGDFLLECMASWHNAVPFADRITLPADLTFFGLYITYTLKLFLKQLNMSTTNQKGEDDPRSDYGSLTKWVAELSKFCSLCSLFSPNFSFSVSVKLWSW